MNKGIFIRLLWREWRENWQFLVVGCGLPLVCAVGYLFASRDIRDMIPGFGMTSVFSILFFQVGAASYARTPKRQGSTRFLPIPVWQEYLSIYIFPALIPMFMGVALGVMMGMTNATGWSHVYSLGAWVLISVFSILVCFFLTTLAIRVSSILMGIFCGFVYFSAMFVFVNSGDKFTAILLPWFLMGLVISIIFWEICVRYRRLAIGRVLITILMAVVLLFPIKGIREGSANLIWNGNDNQLQGVADTYSYNFVYRITGQEYDNHKFVFEDSATGFQRIHQFSKPTIPVVINDDGTRVLLMQESRGELYVHLLCWEPQNDIVTKIADAPLRWFDFRNNEYGYRRRTTYNNNRVYLEFNSLMTRGGQFDEMMVEKMKRDNPSNGMFNDNNGIESQGGGRDIWMIDMKLGRAKLVTGNQKDYLRTVIWEESQASCLIGMSRYVVSFPSMDVAKSELPIRRTPQ